MEEECYPAISMNTACDRLTEETSIAIKEETEDIKEEYSETQSLKHLFESGKTKKNF